MLPLLDVTHLPSSTSYYSAVLQPLGLRYIPPSRLDGPQPAPTQSQQPQPNSPTTAPDCRSSSGLHLGTVISFAYNDRPQTPVLQIRQVADPLTPPRLSRLVFGVSSTTTVAEFRHRASRANPSERSDHNGGGDEQGAPATDEDCDTGATARDLDGNVMEVVYQPPTNYPASYRGSTVRRTQSTKEEVSRILDWNLDVARSTPPQSASGTTVVATRPSVTVSRRHARHPEEDESYAIRRSVTMPTYDAPAYDSLPRRGSGGLSAGAAVGLMAAGALVGATLTYSSMRSERLRAQKQDFDVAPSVQRRSTFPERMTSDGRSLVDVERRVERVGPDDYADLPYHRPAPQYLARYSSAGSVKSRELDDVPDSRSRHSSRYGTSRSNSVRARSETPSNRAPLMITEAEHRSQASARPVEVIRPGRALVLEGDRGSFVSARSHRSSATARPPPPPPPSHIEMAVRSRAGNVLPPSATKLHRGSPVPIPPNSSRSASYFSARPRHSRGVVTPGWDDDNDSVTPDDSISCVGSRRPRRSYY